LRHGHAEHTSSIGLGCRGAAGYAEFDRRQQRGLCAGGGDHGAAAAVVQRGAIGDGACQLSDGTRPLGNDDACQRGNDTCELSDGTRHLGDGALQFGNDTWHLCDGAC
jgi:hypothetical protein